MVVAKLFLLFLFVSLLYTSISVAFTSTSPPPPPPPRFASSSSSSFIITPWGLPTSYIIYQTRIPVVATVKSTKSTRLFSSFAKDLGTSIPISYPKTDMDHRTTTTTTTRTDINITQDYNENYIIHTIIRKGRSDKGTIDTEKDDSHAPYSLQPTASKTATTTMDDDDDNDTHQQQCSVDNNNNNNNNLEDDKDTINESSFPLVSIESSSSSSYSSAVSEPPSLPTTTNNDNNDMNSLSDFDPMIYNLIRNEDHRQRNGLELIASENFCSSNVRSVLSSGLTNKYSEGLPNSRYYGGNIYIDQIEIECMNRALQLYELDTNIWGVNVQPYSGSPANFAVYTALLQPNDRIMGLDLPSGGHLTHGYQTQKGKKVSATSIYFNSMPYIVNPETGYIDYDDLEYRATMFLPKIIIAGGSAYPREWDYQRIRTICNNINAIMMVDMAHISGLVAGKVVVSPFMYADIVTSTTHKTLRGPRSGLIFGKKKYMDAINSAVFPALQGGPHNHQIAALAVALKEAMQPEFKLYTQQILKNAQTLVMALQERNHIIATNGTDNHLLLWNVRASSQNKLTGAKLEKVYDNVSITANKNSIVGDTSAFNPGGIRLGTPALTTRGFIEKDFQYVATLLQKGYEIALDIEQIAYQQKQQSSSITTTATTSTFSEFVSVMEQNPLIQQRMQTLKETVEAFASQFPMP